MARHRPSLRIGSARARRVEAGIPAATLLLAQTLQETNSFDEALLAASRRSPPAPARGRPLAQALFGAYGILAEGTRVRQEAWRIFRPVRVAAGLLALTLAVLLLALALKLA